MSQSTDTTIRPFTIPASRERRSTLLVFEVGEPPPYRFSEWISEGDAGMSNWNGLNRRVRQQPGVFNPKDAEWYGTTCAQHNSLTVLSRLG